MDRIRTKEICHVIILVLCACHASMAAPNYEIAQSYPDTTESPPSGFATTMQSYSRRGSRAYRRGGQDDYDHHHDYDDHVDSHEEEKKESKETPQGRVDYWGGYYDFLINEGSYKFWAVFQLATAALLIYSGFAALYYAKINPPMVDDYDDIFRRRRKRRSGGIRPRDKPFSGLDSATFQRILDAAQRRAH